MADAPAPPAPPVPPAPPAASPVRLDVHHVAKLASLTLAAGEAARLEKELAGIVAYVAQLEQADTREVPPTAHVQLDRMPLRQDVVLPCLSHEDALSQAPSVDAGGFAVPTFVE